MRLVCVLAALVFLLGVAISPRASARHLSPVAAVLHRLRAHAALEVDFREEKRIRLLRRPAISSGHMYYHRDSRSLRRDTLLPTPSSILIVGNRITMRTGARVETLDATRPVVRALSSSFVDLLRGDQAALSANFSLAAQYRDGAFDFTMTATEATLARVISSIEVHGRGDALESLIVREATGDSSTTTFSNATQPAYSAADVARVFR